MNNRLKTICILIALTYLFAVGRTLYLEFPDMKAGFMDGVNSADNLKKGISQETLFLSIKPTKGNDIYPTSIKNQLTGDSIKVHARQLVAQIHNSPIQLDSWLVIARGLMYLLTIGLIIIMIFVPIQTYIIINSVVRDSIFDRDNIRRFQWIGYSILIFYFITCYFEWVNEIIAKKLVAIEGYSFWDESNSTLLLFGLFILLFTEVLKVALKMKEEQDLTV